MKRILSLLLVLLLTVSSLCLMSCDGSPVASSGNDESAESTTQSKQSNGSNKPIPVDGIKGKNAKELLEAFRREFAEATCFDITLNTVSKDEDGERQMEIRYQKAESNLYLQDRKSVV